jgi:hypothetical protein
MIYACAGKKYLREGHWGGVELILLGGNKETERRSERKQREARKNVDALVLHSGAVKLLKK